ncbi:MAG: Nif3-like dinuclear metal center hexameric protein [Prevotellaceae bacterium]|jgi:dinuclear metal center YbgI/SA1388 family protein|nr:Nif3-like dinuclear metal center hexameric protein [Prevotellaceae bacterium]
MNRPTAAQIAAIIEELAPLHYQEPYDNAGFCVGNPHTEITAALLCVDVTDAVLREAIETGANLIISHHPVIFKGLKHLTGQTCVERIVTQAIKHDLVLYAAHTNIDSVRGGVSEGMCQRLGLRHTKILAPREAGADTGFGMAGELPQPLSPADFLQTVKTTFGTPVLRYSQPPAGTITRVAVCGGSGAFLIPAAATDGVQAFISADFKYHDFFDADNHLMIIDVGHYESEQEVIHIFYRCLTKKMPTFAIQMTKNNTNAINYY